MPHAAAHILIPLLIVSFFRDFYAKKKNKKFPLHYALLAGIGGIIPDLDIAAFWILNFFGFTIQQVHRTFAHTIFVPLIFLILAIIFAKLNISELGRHKLKVNMIFLMLAFGSFIHLALDALLQGYVRPFYPFSLFSVGLDLFGFLPLELEKIAAPSLDAGLLILWLVYLELKHKISDFI